MFADDLGYGDVSCHNSGSQIHTENSSDIVERTNLMAKHPEIVGELTDLMKKRIEDGRSRTTPEMRQKIWDLKFGGKLRIFIVNLINYIKGGY